MSVKKKRKKKNNDEFLFGKTQKLKLPYMIYKCIKWLVNLWLAQDG